MFLLVGLTSIVVLSVLTELSTGRDIDAFVRQQQVYATRAAAAEAGTVLGRPVPGGRQAELAPVLGLISREGNRAYVTDNRGRLVASTPGGTAGTAGWPRHTEPVVTGGRRAGAVTVVFENRSHSAALRHLRAERLRASLTAAGLTALLALAVSLLVSRKITLPLDRVLRGIRARGAGNRLVRVPDVRGRGLLHELVVALNESSDAIDARDRLQRDLTANLAHELRTPVAVLQASLEAIQDGVIPMTGQSLTCLREEVLRLAAKIEGLQRLAAAEAASLRLHLTPHDLAAVAADAASSLSGSYAASRVSLIRRLHEKPVSCDPDRLREIITNLLTNALKFTPPGGTVTLITSAGHEPQGILTVTDTGVGIPPEELPRVTERFFRGKHSAGLTAGSGIGLAIVSELVRAQNGQLAITSKPGHGTAVTVTFPQASRKNPARTRTVYPDPEPA